LRLVCKEYQKVAMRLCIQHALTPALRQLIRIRQRLERFRQSPFMNGVAWARSARFVALNLKLLNGNVLPRVQAAVLSTLCNRWTTARRFQQRNRPCAFGCATGEDRLEHYCCCTRVLQWAWQNLGLHPDRCRGIGRWTFSTCELSKRACILQALLVYVAYNAYNCLTSPNSDSHVLGVGMEVGNPVDSSLRLGRLLTGMLQQGTANHASATFVGRRRGF
jgi:hypothetical protein